MGIADLNPPEKLSEFLDMLFYLLTIPTGYCNDSPNGDAPCNCGSRNADGTVTFDCVCLIKAVMEGWNPTSIDQIGEYVYPFTRTGDVNENKLINECAGQSSDFTNMQACAVLCMYGEHIGCYVGGEFNRGGKIYNTIECTPSYGSGVVASYVDENGARWDCKGGTEYGGQWNAYGYMTPWLEYDSQFIDPGSITDPINPGGGVVIPPWWQSPNLNVGMSNLKVWQMCRKIRQSTTRKARF